MFLSNILSLLGLVLIFILLFFSDEWPMRHPSYKTLPAILGTVLIISFAREKNFIQKILSYKILVYLGLISYSFYLIHFPVFAFSRILGFIMKNDNFLKIILIIISLIIATISFKFIETPFRKKIKFEKIIKIILISIGLLIAFNFYMIFSDGLKKRVPEIFSKDMTERPWRKLKTERRCLFK